MDNANRSGGASRSLLMLCAHIPSIDPRLRWAGEYATDHGYRTHIVGFSHKVMEQRPKPASPRVPETIYTPQDARLSNAQILRLMIRHGIWLRPRDTLCLLPYLVCAAPIILPVLLIMGVWALLKWILSSAARGAVWLFELVRFLPKGQAVINLTRHWLRYVPTAFRYLSYQMRRGLGWLMRRLRAGRQAVLKGRLSQIVEGLRGYRWYFFKHGFRYAACLVGRYRAGGVMPPDVIHAHDPDALLAGVILSRIYGSRLIYDAHESGPDAFLVWPKPRFLFYMFERMLLAHVDAAVTVSPALVDDFSRRYRNRPPFHLLPNACPVSDGDYEALEEDELSALAAGRVKVLFQGGFAPERGLEWVIDEWVALGSDRAALFIRGPLNVYRERLVAHADQAGCLNTSVFFMDSVPEEALVAHASQADIGLIPYHSHVKNHQGACPNKLSQYMQAGLAILSTPLPFVEEVLTNAEAGRIYDDTVRGSLGQQLQAYIDCPETLAEAQKKARDFAQTSFNYERYASCLPDLYSGA